MADDRVEIVVEVNLDEAKLAREFAKIQSSAEEAGEAVEKTVNDSIIDSLSKAVGSINELSKGLAGIGATAVALTPLIKNLSDITTLSRDLLAVFFDSRGIFGFISALGGVSAALVTVGNTLSNAENELLSLSGSTIKLIGILTGGFAAALTFATIKIGQLAREVGQNLTVFFDQAAGSFLNAQKELNVLSAVVDNFNRNTNGAIGTIDDYTSSINNLSQELNLSTDSLTKAAQEIIQVGSNSGLARDQLLELVRVSAELAKVNDKDVFQTSVAVVSALNGQSQALQNLGIKLNETAVQQFLLAKGNTENFRTLSESEKVQIRYNKLLSQFSNIRGVAQVAANSLADQQERLRLNQERLSQALGRGAALVERNNLVAAAYNKILNGLSDEAAAAAGFVGALGSRVLQVAGFLLETGLQVFAVTKGIKLLNTVISSNVGISLFAEKLPLINKSLNQLLSNSRKTQVEIKSLNDLLRAFGIISTDAFRNFTAGLTNGRKGLAGITQALNTARLATVNFARTAIAALAPILTPIAVIAAKIALLVGVFELFRRALLVIEQRTGFFSVVIERLSASFGFLGVAIEKVRGFFSSFTESIGTLVSQGFGLFVSGIAKVIGVIAELVARNPFGVFSQETQKAFAGVSARINKFRDDLANANFQISKLPEETSRAVAGVNDALSGLNRGEFQNLLNQFSPDTQLAAIDQEQQQRLELLQQGFDAQLIQQSEFEEARLAIIADAAERRSQILDQLAGPDKTFEAFGLQLDFLAEKAEGFAVNFDKVAKQTANAAIQGFGKGVGAGFDAFGRAIVNGENALAAFGQALLATFGNALSQLGQGFILQGIAQSIAGFGSGAPLIAAGAALTVFGGALSAIGGGGSTGEGAAIGAGASAGNFGGGVDSAVSEPDTEERAEPETRIAVNVQGDIFDTTDTGLRLVELIQDEFDRTNATVSGGFA